MKQEKNQTKVFILEKVGYTDLEGNFITIPFKQKEFSNALYNNALSIDMRDFARSIHSDGKADIIPEVERELLELLPNLYAFIAVQGVKEYLETL